MGKFKFHNVDRAGPDGEDVMYRETIKLTVEIRRSWPKARAPAGSFEPRGEATRPYQGSRAASANMDTASIVREMLRRIEHDKLTDE